MTIQPELIPWFLCQLHSFFFAWGSYLDIFTDHRMPVSAVYSSVWAIVGAVNSSSELDIKFPDHDKQVEIAQGFKNKIKAGFDVCLGFLDGMLI